MQENDRGGSVATLTAMNRALVMRALHRLGVCSRADIAREVGLTPTAITKITNDLIALGAVEETGPMPGRAGRRSIGVRLNGERYRVIGVSFTRSAVAAGVFTLAGDQVGERVSFAVERGRDAGEVVGRICDWMRDSIAADPSIVAAGVSIPGPYLPADGRIAVVTVASGWQDIDFRATFVEGFDIPVFLEHDAAAGAIAQKLLSRQCAGRTSPAYMLLGEGIGLGVIDHDRLLSGVNGGAGEIGHMSIDINGPVCACGNHGCLELYCSTDAVRTLVANEYPDMGESSSPDVCRRLFVLAGAGDARAARIVDEIGTIVGYGCVSVINAYDPGVIVLGDELSRAGEPLLDAVRRVVDERVAPALARRTTILISDLGGDEVMDGAVALAIEHALDDSEAFARVRW